MTNRENIIATYITQKNVMALLCKRTSKSQNRSFINPREKWARAYLENKKGNGSQP